MPIRNILSEQEKAALKASIARSESKRFFRKKVMPVAVVMSVLFTMLFWWKNLPVGTVQAILEEKPKVVHSQQQDVPVQRQQQLPVVKEAEWEGGVPVIGQWSKTFQIPVGCETKYGTGNGIKYLVQYRMYGDSNWKDHQVGRVESASEIQFMLLQEEVGIPFTLKCS